MAKPHYYTISVTHHAQGKIQVSIESQDGCINYEAPPPLRSWQSHTCYGEVIPGRAAGGPEGCWYGLEVVYRRQALGQSLDPMWAPGLRVRGGWGSGEVAYVLHEYGLDWEHTVEGVCPLRWELRPSDLEALRLGEARPVASLGLSSILS